MSDGGHALRIKRWLTGASLPLWSSVGVDPAGGFVERLFLDGRPDFDAPKRVRVQARQIYVFALASRLGLLPEGLALALRAFEFLMANARLEGGGFARALSRRGSLFDATRDAYDHAFVLLAVSALYRAAPSTTVLSAVKEAAGAIELLRHPSGRGYREDDKGGTPRWQNPHMHLFEAFLSAYGATGDALYLERAAHIKELFDTAFFNREAGAMTEYFTEDLKPLPGDKGRTVEPGHQFEWTWLLHEHAKASGAPPADEARRIYEFAVKYGVDPATGLVFDSVWLDGAPQQRSKRCWPQTEALKAELVRSEASGVGISARAGEIVDGIFAYFLDQPVKGAWQDQRGEDNAPLARYIPASTLYHLMLAFTEYLRVSETGGGGAPSLCPLPLPLPLPLP